MNNLIGKEFEFFFTGVYYNLKDRTVVFSGLLVDPRRHSTKSQSVKCYLHHLLPFIGYLLSYITYIYLYYFIYAYKIVTSL